MSPPVPQPSLPLVPGTNVPATFKDVLTLTSIAILDCDPTKGPALLRIILDTLLSRLKPVEGEDELIYEYTAPLHTSTTSRTEPVRPGATRATAGETLDIVGAVAWTKDGHPLQPQSYIFTNPPQSAALPDSANPSHPAPTTSARMSRFPSYATYPLFDASAPVPPFPRTMPFHLRDQAVRELRIGMVEGVPITCHVESLLRRVGVLEDEVKGLCVKGRSWGMLGGEKVVEAVGETTVSGKKGKAKGKGKGKVEKGGDAGDNDRKKAILAELSDGGRAPEVLSRLRAGDRTARLEVMMDIMVDTKIFSERDVYTRVNELRDEVMSWLGLLRDDVARDGDVFEERIRRLEEAREGLRGLVGGLGARVEGVIGGIEELREEVGGHFAGAREDVEMVRADIAEMACRCALSPRSLPSVVMGRMGVGLGLGDSVGG